MSQAQARPRADEDFLEGTPPPLRAVPDDLTPEERRDWQRLSERRERAEQADARRRRPAPGTMEPSARRGGTQGQPARSSTSVATHAVPARAEASPVVPRPSLPAPRRPAPEPDHPEPSARRAVRTNVAPAHRRRRRRMPWAGIAAGPDRLALWAVVLCLFMALVAAATARGSEPGVAEAAGSDGAAPAAQTVGPQRP